MKSSSSILLVLTLAAGNGAWAHGDATHKPQSAKKSISTEEKSFGREGHPGKTTRTITVTMSDRMRFSPDTIQIQQGETVQLVIRNRGKILHELVLGTMAELQEHAALMKKFPGMEHDEPHMAHVSPAKEQKIVWQFTRAGEFYFGCLIPGHFEAGMVGKINVTAR